MKATLYSAALAALFVSSSAMAADMPVKAPVYKAPPPVAAYNWSGFYTASTLGGGWQDIRGDYVLPPPDHHNTNKTKAWYDSHVGYQWQWNRIVLGVEGTYAIPLGKEWASTASPSPDCLASVPNRLCESRFRNIWGAGGKVGFTWDRWMIYGTGGWASARIETRDRVASTGVINIAEADKYRHSGWYAGAGVDWYVTKFFFSDVIFGIEYRHYDFDTERHFPSVPGTPAPIVVNADTRDVSGRLDVISARLTFKYSPAGVVRAAY